MEDVEVIGVDLHRGKALVYVVPGYAYDDDGALAGPIVDARAYVNRCLPAGWEVDEDEEVGFSPVVHHDVDLHPQAGGRLMPRPAPGLASVAADLDRHAAGERPEWVSAATWRRAVVLAAALRADAIATIAAGGAVAAAEALGVHRDTLREWRTRGWLREPHEPEDRADG